MAVASFGLGWSKTTRNSNSVLSAAGTAASNESWDAVVLEMLHILRSVAFGLVFFAGMLWAQAIPSPSQQAGGSAPTGSGDSTKVASEAPVTKQAKPEQSGQAGAVQPEDAVPSQPVEPKQPKTEILDSSATAGALATDGHDPILDPPPFPKGTTTLVGGVISGIDPIRNHLMVSVFGGARWTIFYDERTHIFRNGAEVTSLSLKKGERVYVDTMLDNNGRDIFARNIRVGVAQPPALIDGQIIDFDLSHSLVTLRDAINTGPVHFSIDNETKISDGLKLATVQDLVPGSLVRVKFAPERANRGLAREITIIAKPGSSHTFAGLITFLDTHRGIIAVRNRLDDKTYDLHFSPRTAGIADLAVGAEVQVTAIFTATEYSVQQVTVTRRAGSRPR
jgi:hypothetical protein